MKKLRIGWIIISVINFITFITLIIQACKYVPNDITEVRWFCLIIFGICNFIGLVISIIGAKKILGKSKFLSVACCSIIYMFISFNTAVYIEDVSISAVMPGCSNIYGVGIGYEHLGRIFL